MSREKSRRTILFVLLDMQNRSPVKLIFNNDEDDDGDEAENSLK
jgi:hypothetical protein